VPKALAPPPPNSTPSARAVLLEAEARKSAQEEMAAPEELPPFGSVPSLEEALPQEGEARSPLMVEAPALTMGVGPSAEAQEAMKEAMPEGPSVQVGSKARGGS
jgi:hypothetical protein